MEFSEVETFLKGKGNELLYKKEMAEFCYFVSENLLNAPDTDSLKNIKNRKLSKFMDVLRKITPRNKRTFISRYIFK